MRHSSPSVRIAEKGDVPAIAGILRELGWFPKVEEKLVARHLELCQADASHTVLVSLDDEDRVAGYTAAHWLPYLVLPGLDGYVSDLFVKESHRRQGHGAALLAAVEELAREKGCRHLSLLNSRDRASYERDYYKRLGWTERGDIADFILDLAQG